MASGGSPLTPRQAEVLALVCDEEETNAAVARRLGVSAHTIKNHLFVIYRRLGVQTRAGACCRYGHEAERVAAIDAFRADRV